MDVLPGNTRMTGCYWTTGYFSGFLNRFDIIIYVGISRDSYVTKH